MIMNLFKEDPAGENMGNAFCNNCYITIWERWHILNSKTRKRWLEWEGQHSFWREQGNIRKILGNISINHFYINTYNIISKYI